MGLSMSPCLTPEDTLNDTVKIPFILMCAFDEEYIVDKILNSLPCIPNDSDNLYNKRSRFTQSNAF